MRLKTKWMIRGVTGVVVIYFILLAIFAIVSLNQRERRKTIEAVICNGLPAVAVQLPDGSYRVELIMRGPEFAFFSEMRSLLGGEVLHRIERIAPGFELLPDPDEVAGGSFYRGVWVSNPPPPSR